MGMVSRIAAPAVAALAVFFSGCGEAPAQKPAEAKPGAAATNAAAKAAAATNAAAKAVAANAAEKAGAKAEEKEKPRPLPMVTSFDVMRKGVALELNYKPDLKRLKEFLKFTPDPGGVEIDRARWYSWNSWNSSGGTFYLTVSGDFKPGAEYRLDLLKGLPAEEEEGQPLPENFRRTWKAPDLDPEISLVRGARYLPAAGRRAVALEVVNVTNVHYSLWSVPPQNVVQLLARENGKYSNHVRGWGESFDTRELSLKIREGKIAVDAPRNEKARIEFDVRDSDGKAECGAYYLIARERESFGNPGANEDRVICVTDIGLSVRKTPGGLYAWATSLSTGKPLAGRRVAVYGPNNVVLSEGLTDPDGWCFCELEKDADAFAVVASAHDSPDVSFLALNGNEKDEPESKGGAETDGSRTFPKKTELEAFVWSDRGIYRHNEKILVHALVRNGEGMAPRPFPLQFEFADPEFNVKHVATAMTDRYGSAHVSFAADDSAFSGNWTVRVSAPGAESRIGWTEFKIEEFVPPQIRVKVVSEGEVVSNRVPYAISAEHLFGGPAKSLYSSVSLSVKDEPFKPEGWEGWTFGDGEQAFAPTFKRFGNERLDGEGKFADGVTLDLGVLPNGALGCTFVGTVFEYGGRGVSARAKRQVHVRPYYAGIKFPETMRRSKKPVAAEFALVGPDGKAFAAEKEFEVEVSSVSFVYALETRGGTRRWETTKVETPIGNAAKVRTGADGRAKVMLPAEASGEYAVKVMLPEDKIAMKARYVVAGDYEGRMAADLGSPAEVSIVPEKKSYLCGERPKVTVKSPFRGYAWLTVMNTDVIYSEVHNLTNHTTEIELSAVDEKWCPGVGVAVTAVQAAKPGDTPMANRACGRVAIRCERPGATIPVKVKANVKCRPEGGADLTVDVEAAGNGAKAERAVVTVVDEAINLLTNRQTPDPAGWFGMPREFRLPFYDLYDELFPVLTEKLVKTGVKTGGGADSDLFRRLSAMPTRRFRPLSAWRTNVKLADGKGRVEFSLPEFSGEIRATAVAYAEKGTGSGAVQAKVTPKLVMQADAPRFAAPGDKYAATLTLHNRSGKEGTVKYSVESEGPAGTVAGGGVAEVKLADGASATVSFDVTAGRNPGEGKIRFVAEGLGEKHTDVIDMPVRAAAPWSKKTEVFTLGPGESRRLAAPGGSAPESAVRRIAVSGSPLANLVAALEHLADYPYGCLEQTVSKVHPLLAAGGLLNTLPAERTSAAADAALGVDAGIARVVSMIGGGVFRMWPDAGVEPWDKEVSVRAAAFLLEASRSGREVPQEALHAAKRVLHGLARPAKGDMRVSVHAGRALAEAGLADRERLEALKKESAKFGPRERYALSRAFSAAGERKVAAELVADVPGNIGAKAVSEAILAIMAIDPKDARLPGLAAALVSGRDGGSGHWGTTELNAGALIALGTYYRANMPPAGKPDVAAVRSGAEVRVAEGKSAEFRGDGEIEVKNTGAGVAYVTYSSLSIPDPADLKPEASHLAIARKYYDVEWKEIDVSKAMRGEILYVEVALTNPGKAEERYTDLVIEDLLPACFEPDHTDISHLLPPSELMHPNKWELRRELRDDRAVAFSIPFSLKPGEGVRFVYPVRVVGAGEYVAPGAFAEAMYDRGVRARGAAARITVAK